MYLQIIIKDAKNAFKNFEYECKLSAFKLAILGYEGSRLPVNLKE